MTAYGLISDTHHHNWHQFSTVTAEGVNSRLQHILDEEVRAAKAIQALGGKRIYHGGDLFHVRGSIAPSVLNPTLDNFKRIRDENGIEVRILAGNHDLEGRDSERLGSAVTALEGVCTIVNKPTLFHDDEVVMIPWHQNVADLKVTIAKMVEGINGGKSGTLHHSWTLIIHAPVDGVIPGLPSHGMTDKDLKDFGFYRVFSGHYHCHKDFGNGVYSIGALTHQTWSDLNSKAGFLTVTPKDVLWYKSHAPEFTEVTAEMDEVEIKDAADGCYVRAKISSTKKSDVEAVREFLIDSGAKGVVIIVDKSSVEAERKVVSVKAGASIEQSVNSFIESAGMTDAEQVKILCASILSEARAEVAE